MSAITRFAPSPTGFLHVGNLRMALINYLLSKQTNGKFILRIDDTDFERSSIEYQEAIKEDLKWLGLNWSSTFKQSDNLEVYHKYLKQLQDQELIYPCYETKEELDYKRKIQLAKGAPPIYDRSALKLTEEQKKALEQEGRKPYYRFKITAEAIEWVDLIKGPVKFNGEHLSDPVLIKENGVFLYSFCSVVDDIERNITHIIRGEDHLSNTAVHVQLFKYLGFKPPYFGHMSLLSMLDGEELSKRTGSNSVRDLKSKGIHPLAILNYLFMLGQSEQNKIYSSINEMVQDFNLQNYSKSLVKFDNNKLYQINSLLLQNLSFNAVKADLANIGITIVTEELWNLYKGNIKSLLEIADYYNVLYGTIISKTTNKELIELALKTLPSEDSFTENTINAWVNNIAQNSNLKKKELFSTLREALTGSISGPNFKDLILTMGKQKILERLTAALAQIGYS